MQKIVAILPMRAGSQRVINGKHLYEYIIDKLLNFNLISNIIINTDIEMVHEKYISNEASGKFVLRISATWKETLGKYFFNLAITSELISTPTIS